MEDQKKQKLKREPNAHDKYQGAKDSKIKFILEDKNGKKTIIKR